jgi:hypothetical protein
MLRREFDQVSKNCRILAFKLKKAERRMEEMENEKVENDKKAKEVCKYKIIVIINIITITIQFLQLIERLQNDLEKSKSNVSQVDQKKRPMLGMIPKSASGEVYLCFD